MRVRTLKYILDSIQGVDELDDLIFEFDNGRVEKFKYKGIVFKKINGRTPKVVIKFDNKFQEFGVKPSIKK